MDKNASESGYTAATLKRKFKGFLRRRLQKSKAAQTEVEILRDHLRSKNLVKEETAPGRNFADSFFHIFDRLARDMMRAKMSKDTTTAANVFFGGIVRISPQYFEPLKEAVVNSDMDIVAESYIGDISALSVIVAGIASSLVFFESAYFGAGILLSAISAAAAFILVFFAAFTVGYMYPFRKIESKRSNINANLPFAINHMAAIASSGVPPEKAFEMMAEFKEYGAISTESKNIVKQINIFGKDILTALHYTAGRTPSKEFKELLYGILSIIKTGGNLKDYLNEMAQLALFNYQLARKKYIETLSTYADIYTAILIAAPLFLVSILAVMNIIPGSLVGSLTIEEFMKIGVYVLIPGLNIGFLLFITYTQPEM